MKKSLNDADKALLESKISEAESRTKVEFLLAFTEKCDDYPEIPWKAFALGVSVSLLFSILYILLYPSWINAGLVFGMILVTLVFSSLLSLLTLLSDVFARVFLPEERAHAETMQFAESFFYRRDFGNTNARNAVLVLVSLFEKYVVLIPDRGLEKRLSNEEANAVVNKITRKLREDGLMEAYKTAIDKLVKILETSVPAGESKNELPNEIIFIKGEKK
jgi:putative membrane protein